MWLTGNNTITCSLCSVRFTLTWTMWLQDIFESMGKKFWESDPSIWDSINNTGLRYALGLVIADMSAEPANWVMSSCRLAVAHLLCFELRGHSTVAGINNKMPEWRETWQRFAVKFLLLKLGREKLYDLPSFLLQQRPLFFLCLRLPDDGSTRSGNDSHHFIYGRSAVYLQCAIWCW